MELKKKPADQGKKTEKPSLFDRYKGRFISHGDLTEPAFPEEDWECLK